MLKIGVMGERNETYYANEIDKLLPSVLQRHTKHPSMVKNKLEEQKGLFTTGPHLLK